MWDVVDCGGEAVQGGGIVVLGVDNPDDGAEFGEEVGVVEGWVEVVELTWEIPDLEVHKGFHCVFLHALGGFEVEGFLGCHFVEDD